jgi:dTDP-4-dehydrorhamnose 3,5-epimerase
MVYKKICPQLHLDDRGSLFEIYSAAQTYKVSPKHIYISRSTYGIVRGFHQQLEVPQKKMVFCLSGDVADFGLNIDPLSSNFGAVNRHILSGEAGEGVIIGRKVAHGFECLSDECTLLYICDDHYAPTKQLSINPLDESFSSLWKTNSLTLSPKDREGVSLQTAKQILSQNLGK